MKCVHYHCQVYIFDETHLNLKHSCIKVPYLSNNVGSYQIQVGCSEPRLSYHTNLSSYKTQNDARELIPQISLEGLVLWTRPVYGIQPPAVVNCIHINH